MSQSQNAAQPADRNVEQLIDQAAQELNARQAEIDGGQSKIAPHAKTPAARKLSPDQAWARKNLRFRDGRPYTDLANVLRVLERQEEYQGRFIFNETINKVLDRGSVMLDWKVSEVTATIQERFIPEVPEEIVGKALVICANRNGVRK